MEQKQSSNNTFSRKKVEEKYVSFITQLSGLSLRIGNLKGENSSFTEIQRAFLAVLKDHFDESKKQLEEVRIGTTWDNLVIAFFGETNAGKSTIIETCRILFEDESRKQEMKRQGHSVDGEIVGDGQADFTKTYKEYHLTIHNKAFTLIDVPGIEGNENDFKEEIKKALNQAHCIFYVQGHNKKPDTATAEKIRKYLSNWVSVYSIYNVRGGSGNYDEPDERISLASESIRKNETLIRETFEGILGNIYKENITLQALLAMCARADFSPGREDLLCTQRKLTTYFKNQDELFRFSEFGRLIDLIDKKSDNYIDEIVEANKQKLIAIARKVYYGIEYETRNQKERTLKLKNALIGFRQEVNLIFTKTGASIQNRFKAQNDLIFSEYGRFVCEAIDNKAWSDDTKKRQIEAKQNLLSKELKTQLENALREEIANLNRNLEAKRKELDKLKNVNYQFNDGINASIQIDLEFVLDKMDINLKDAVGLAAAAASGALMGSAFTWLAPGVATAVGGIIGGGLHLLRKGIFGDGGRGEAKEVARKQINEAKTKTMNDLNRKILSINNKLDMSKRPIIESLAKEIANLESLELMILKAEKEIKDFTVSIKNKEHGNI